MTDVPQSEDWFRLETQEKKVAKNNERKKEQVYFAIKSKPYSMSVFLVLIQLFEIKTLI